MLHPKLIIFVPCIDGRGDCDVRNIQNSLVEGHHQLLHFPVEARETGEQIGFDLARSLWTLQVVYHTLNQVAV